MNIAPLPASRGKRSRGKLATPPAPKHLEKPERQLWVAILRENDLDGEASLAILRTALESHQRARQSREAIERDGPTVRDRFGQIRVHPLIAAERDARASFLAGMRALRLDFELAR